MSIVVSLGVKMFRKERYAVPLFNTNPTGPFPLSHQQLLLRDSNSSTNYFGSRNNLKLCFNGIIPS